LRALGRSGSWKNIRPAGGDAAGAGIWHNYLFGTAGEGDCVFEVQLDTIVNAFAQVTRESEGFPMIGLISLSRVRQSVDAQTATSPSGTRDAAVVD